MKAMTVRAVQQVVGSRVAGFAIVTGTVLFLGGLAWI